MVETLGNHYLLEIGTEELPAAFLLSAPAELSHKVKALLDEQTLAHGEVYVYATPRRLALFIESLPALQDAREQVIKGPPVRVAFNADGSPTQAGLGFARKAGIEFERLIQEEIDGEHYLVLRETLPGKPTKDILADALPELVLSLNGSHFMAWGNHTVRFSRPIRWLCSLWNNEQLPIQIGPVTSGTLSYGHRILSDGPIQIPSATAYLQTLETQGAVIADPAQRRKTIWQLLQARAERLNALVKPNEDLLDTVTMLVEYPSVVVGQFEERFLEIPAEVTSTVMIAHQKYFPVETPQGELLPYFMTISNGRAQAEDSIRLGNQKVLTARLEDARFFYTEDQKQALASRLEDLKGITFQKGLGSLYEKTLRLESLTQHVASAMGLNAEHCALATRAAHLAKADLVTGMVFEFTELQGSMGRKYAALSGEPQPVCEAIYEHYLPRFMGDANAQTQPGIAVSLADKLDTMVAVFSLKNAKLPSGSKDPLGLRRMASGLIQTVLEHQLNIDLLALMSEAYRALAASAPANTQLQDEATTLNLVNTFILQRLRGLFLEQEYRYDMIDAILEAEKSPLQDLGNAAQRLAVLKQLSQQPELLKAISEPANRIIKILGKNDNPTVALGDIQEALLKQPEEQALWAAVHPLMLQNKADFPLMTWCDHLAALNPTVERFFEKVMVNDPDDTVRKNRYNLLSTLNRFYLQLACFPKLAI